MASPPEDTYEAQRPGGGSYTGWLLQNMRDDINSLKTREQKYSEDFNKLLTDVKLLVKTVEGLKEQSDKSEKQLDRIINASWLVAIVVITAFAGITFGWFGDYVKRAHAEAPPAITEPDGGS